MEILKIVGIGLVTCIAGLILKPIKPEISILIGVCGGVLVLFFTIDYVGEILGVFQFLLQKTGLSSSANLFSLILKILGIGYITEFAANVCSDSGMAGLGDKILLAGKVIIFTLALPIISNIVDIIVGLLSWKKHLH